jgi:aspartyl-tRNA(Asn)/glutamyl-tRNA(Gln) amidotransferase subunit A
MVWAARLPAGPGHPGATHHSQAAVTADGLPIGLQIVGRRLDDALVLRASAAFEAAAPWRDRWRPILAESGFIDLHVR